jgi:4-hydroxyphenylpyruvate dioxygenase
VPAGRHRSKPVTWWRHGGAHLVVNDTPPPAAALPHALGVAAPAVEAVAARAKALLWPAVDRTRGAGEALLPGITSPAGLHVFVSAEPGADDDWQRDFLPVPGPAAGPAGAGEEGWLGIDHVAVAVPPEHFDQQVAFFRTLFDLAPGAVEEFIEPHGRLRSRALRPATGDLRVVLNVEDVRAGSPRRSGITQVAFACSDVVARVREMRARGVPLMPVPDNYYVDLDARLGVDPDLLAQLREHGLLYDRVGDGELLHAFTLPLATGFHVELLERRGGYDGYGSAGTHVRLAAQRSR